MLNVPHSAWANSTEEITSLLEVNEENGLSDAEVKKRQESFAENVFESSKEKSALSIFIKQFTSPLIIILIVAVVITASLGEWLDTFIIAFAVIVNAILGFIQEFKAEKAITDLRSYITHRTLVIRSGKEIEIDPKFIVPGDILHITRGKRITADARLLQEINFTADESILTGESLPVEKDVAALDETTLLPNRINMVFAGTLGINGSAKAVVTATGYDTEIGKLAKLVADTESEVTPLQKALTQLTWVIIAVTTIAVIGIFTIGILQNQPLYEMLLISIAVLVGSVPEALPIGLTAILAIGVERIAKKKGIMRSLTAAETLGSTTLLITDKTGTLTQADMQLVEISQVSELLQKDFELKDTHEFNTDEKSILKLARAACDISIENPDADTKDWHINGSDLEINITRMSAENGIDQTIYNNSEISIKLPFSSKHKFSVTRIPSGLLPKPVSDIKNPHVVMGAPDILLKMSSLSLEEKKRINSAIEDSSSYGRRVLGVAILDTDLDKITVDDTKDITFIGTLGFHDPIRPEVESALENINSYGTRVIMATGDLPGTALAIAREVGWEINHTNILTGQQLKRMTDEELASVLHRVHIYARVTPEDKLRITRLHQAKGEVVAMTGDGVNDAPSLKAANIGIAVGSGSDVAKSVSDLILLDNNFDTIVSTIEEGKQILSNIKKMFVYLMSNALDELILIGGALVASVALPLTAAQIIWVNLFTGSLPAIAFAFDRQQMKETTETSREFFNKRILFLTIFIGIVVSLMLFSLYMWLLTIGISETTASSILFASFGTYTIFIAFSFVDLTRPIFSYSLIKNKLLVAGFLVGIIMMIIPFSTPFLREVFSVEALPTKWIGFVLLWSLVNIAVVELSKWFADKYIVKEVDKSSELA